MFRAKCINIDSPHYGEIFTIYGTTYIKASGTSGVAFLIYDDYHHEWKWVSADDFVPYKEED